MSLKCPFCGSNKAKPYCIDWQHNQYVECNHCRFVYQNIYKQFDYSMRYWSDAVDPDGKHRDLTGERDFKVKNWYGGIIDYINKQKGGKILDAGCGLGFLLSAVGSSWEKAGFEISPDAVAFIKRRSPDITIYNNLEHIPKGSFDIVVCYHVIEHLEEPVGFFQSLVDFVSAGGTLVIGTPNIRSFCSRWFKGNYRLLGNGHLCMFSPSHLSKLFSEHGLDLVNREYPFFKTGYFTLKNLLRLLNRNKISPPFYGNIMTFYGRK